MTKQRSFASLTEEEINRDRRAPTEQFPPNTIWALVRHAILLDRDSKPVISPIRPAFTYHGQSGIHSVNSRTRFFEDVNARPVELRIANLDELANITQFKTRAMSNWQLLRWIIADHSGN